MKNIVYCQTQLLESRIEIATFSNSQNIESNMICAFIPTTIILIAKSLNTFDCFNRVESLQ